MIIRTTKVLHRTASLVGSVLLALGPSAAVFAADAPATATTTPVTATAAPSPAVPVAVPPTPQAAATPTAPVPATTAPATADATPPQPGATPATADAAVPKMMVKPGQMIIMDKGAGVEDIDPTDDVNKARAQANHFADSPEAAFILAVALTRTSHVEEALSEVKTARNLARAKGGPEYFDKMIQSYEDMLKNAPDDNRIRYQLAWAYYMKAYLIAQDSKKQLQAVQAAQAMGIPAVPTAPAAAPGAPSAAPNQAVPNAMTQKAANKKVNTDLAQMVIQSLSPQLAGKSIGDGKTTQASSLPHIPGALEKAAPSAVPVVHQYYALAMQKLDEILAKNPDDVWTIIYRWHLYSEDTGDVDTAIAHWRAAETKFPTNPGVQFFLGSGYMRKGNLKEAIRHAGQAVMLRGVGM